MIYLLLLVILIGIIFFIFSPKPIYSIVFMLYVSSINFSTFLSNEINTYIKLLFLSVFLFFILRRGIALKFIVPILLIVILFSVNIVLASYDSIFSYSDSLTAVTSVITGVIVCLVFFSDEEKNVLLKSLCFIPLFSLTIGVLFWPLGFINPFARGNYFGLAGAASSTNLAFYSVIAIASSLFIFKKNDVFKYRVLAYINYFIVCGSLTRGGILAGTVIILFDFIPFLKKLFASKRTFLPTIITIIVMAVPMYFIINQLMSRTFIDDGLNTSGRLEAWDYIISLCKNKYIGNGYGFLKTREEKQLDAFTAAHNEYVHLYLEIGIIGIVIFAFSFFIIVHRVFKFSNYNFKTKFFIFTVFISFLVYSIFDNTISNYHFWIPFMIMLSSFSMNGVNEYYTSKNEALKYRKVSVLNEEI